MAERRADAAAVVLLGPETQHARVERHLRQGVRLVVDPNPDPDLTLTLTLTLSRDLREGVRLGVDPDAQVGCDEVELVRGRDRMRGRFRLSVRARVRFTVRVRVTEP